MLMHVSHHGILHAVCSCSLHLKLAVFDDVGFVRPSQSGKEHNYKQRAVDKSMFPRRTNEHGHNEISSTCKAVYYTEMYASLSPDCWLLQAASKGCVDCLHAVHDARKPSHHPT
jgi:hypothetical protein